MKHEIVSLIDKLCAEHCLTLSEYRQLLCGESTDVEELLTERAAAAQRAVYGNAIYIRGLMEIGNVCKNDCLYCGIRRDNAGCERYRLGAEEILACCRQGYALGFRTFVLQGGEDAHWTDDRLCAIIAHIKREFSDCAVTLSLGERSEDSYQALFDAGADRYLLRHETADRAHYEKLHPPEMSFDNRMRCLASLKQIGYQTGCGFMVGSPYQTVDTLAKDLKFIETFDPAMCGIGPFIPHDETPFGNHPAGTLSRTLMLLSIIRLMKPGILLPATTALGTIHPWGRELGILSGANVVMPNLSPANAREKYMLYNNKLHSDEEAAEGLETLKRRVAAIGYEIVCARGDAKSYII